MILLEEEKEAAPDFDISEYAIEDAKLLAKHYIDMFFKDKSLYCGGSIPKNMLHKDRYISAVLNLDICNGMDYIYDAVGVTYTEEQMRYYERQGQLPEDVKYVISLFSMCAKAGIPKQFAVGIIVIYLELCEGHKLAA
jgi:hypothetical protein